MSKRHVSLLAITLVLVVGAIFLLLPGETSREPSDLDQAAVPGLEAMVNEVDRIEAVAAGGVTLATLERDADGWSVAEFAGYPADIEVLRDVLGGIAQARVLEPKTDNPAYYARLGVEDVTAPDAGGVRLDLSSGDQRWSVIVGEEAPARGGHYLRRADVAGSVLADFEGDVPADAKGWVSTRVVDLLAGEVAEVQVVHADGETLTATKVSADETDFTLAELPEGREIKSAWSVNSLGSTLATLDLEGVARADAFAWDDALALRALRFDGLEVAVQLLRNGEDGDWIRLSASAPEPIDLEANAAVQESESDSEPEADSPDAAPAESDDAEVIANAMAEVVAEAEAINARVDGWAYRIPAYKADAMDQRLTDLLKDLPEGGADAG